METSALLEFIRLVVAGDTDRVSRRLNAAPALAATASPVGATRQQATNFFFTAISHYLYAGDTALHMAAAAFSRPMAELLVAHGADCRAKNRRGAEPLHYAADGGRREPRAQAGVIEYLISVGAEPNVVDKSGVAPLHRAVRRGRWRRSGRCWTAARPPETQQGGIDAAASGRPAHGGKRERLGPGTPPTSRDHRPPLGTRCQSGRSGRAGQVGRSGRHQRMDSGIAKRRQGRLTNG